MSHSQNKLNITYDLLYYLIVNCFIKDINKYNEWEEEEIQENVKDKYFDFSKIHTLNKSVKEEVKEEPFLKSKRKRNTKISQSSEEVKPKGSNLFRVFSSSPIPKLNDENSKVRDSHSHSQSHDEEKKLKEGINKINIQLKCMNVDSNQNSLYEATLVRKIILYYIFYYSIILLLKLEYKTASRLLIKSIKEVSYICFVS